MNCLKKLARDDECSLCSCCTCVVHNILPYKNCDTLGHGAELNNSVNEMRGYFDKLSADFHTAFNNITDEYARKGN